MNGLVTTGKKKLVVELVTAYNLMPKDREGSSSAFGEVEFENQRHQTQVKRKWRQTEQVGVKKVEFEPHLE